MDFRTFVFVVFAALIISAVMLLFPATIHAGKRFFSELADNPPTFTYDVDEFWARPRC